MRVFRGMISDDDGLPRVGATGRTLGARPGYAGDEPEPDIELGPGGVVQPGIGGMSVSTPPIANLPPHRRPPEHGGTVKKIKVYELDTDTLPEELRYRIDPFGRGRHVFIEPSVEMPFEEYQRALHNTRHLWRSVP